MKEWQAFLEEQKKELGCDAIDRWAKSLKIINFDAGNLYLEAEDPFQLYWFEQYLRPLIKAAFKNINGRSVHVHLSLINATLPVKKKEWIPPLNLTPDSILSNRTFTTYFSGVANDPPFKLFQDVLKRKNFNPIYLHGPSGVGKTHLLMAACHQTKQQGQTYFYVKADRFTQHIVAAMRGGAMPQFRELYRRYDVLVLDEVEQLSERTASQEELFHTFNTLHLAGKQILLAGQELPSRLKGIEPRLTSRFEWGLVLSFQPLTPSEQALFFHQLLHQKKITLDPEIAQACLSLLPSIPLLYRAADILEVRLKEAKPTLPLLQIWFATLIQEHKRKALTSETIFKAVASHFDIRPSDLCGKSQTSQHTTPRQVAMYLCRKQLHLPYTKIGEIFSRDHSTVMTSVKLIDKKLKETPLLQDAVRDILETLKKTL